jgi:hypothetical protein
LSLTDSLGLDRDEGDDLADVLEAVDEADDVEVGGGEAAGFVDVLLQAEDQLL